MALFDFLERFVADPDYKAVYVLMLICIAMTIDFISGTIAAKINPEIEFKSKIGINGILRKVASIVLLLFHSLSTVSTWWRWCGAIICSVCWLSDDGN